MSFTHLHLHTEYSLLDGYSRIDSLFQQVKALGMTSVAITDHGVMFGVVDFYKAAKAHGIHPIIGCEVYVAARSTKEKDPVIDKGSSHLVLLAENQIGYQNLIKLVSLGYTEGFYYKPRVDKEQLTKYSEGLIALSACLAGDIPQALLSNRYEEAQRLLQVYLGIFGKDHFFLELQDHDLPEQKKVNLGLLKLANAHGVGIVATNDVHYLARKDAQDHDVLLCIQTGKNLTDTDRMRFPNQQFYLKSPEEMAKLFHYCPEAIANTEKIAKRCQVTFDFSTLHLPTYPTAHGQSAKELLFELCEKGLSKRYDSREDARERMLFELAVICDMGYEDYFLIVWDFIRHAKSQGIWVGPGRGSGGGSLVAYVLGITDIDPLYFGLIFERFLNPERITMPDFDIDFQDNRRQEVIDYVIQKYGQDHVAQIITFGTMGARAAIRDVGRVMGLPYQDVDQVAKCIPFAMGITIEEALKASKELKALYDEEADIHQLIETAKSLEGMPRHASTHAAGVVISRLSVDHYVPLYKHEDSISTQFNMTRLEELGLLKMDFLGLRTLTVMEHALALIKEQTGIDLDFEAIGFNDEKTYQLIASGQTLGLFQLESSGMRRFLKELKPTCIEDIVAGISLYRPGPMESIPAYIKNKNKPETIHYRHPILKDILEVTYGCLVYQEQVMEIVRRLGGYSYGRSDLVRSAMSKKKMDVMEKERQIFINGQVNEDNQVTIAGCLRLGVDQQTANIVFDEMAEFAKYAFNKSHAAGYAVIAYQTAYLKTHFPLAFMAAQMTSMIGSHSKIAQYIGDCKTLGIPVLAPDINHSKADFSVDGNAIRYGLLAIKNVGRGIIESIIKARGNRPFTDFQNFLAAIEPSELSKKAIESFIKAGAVDCFGIARSRLLLVYENLIDGILSERRRTVAGQISLFSDGTLIEQEDRDQGIPQKEEFRQAILLNFEKEMLGIYLSGHPLDPYVKWIKGLQTIQLMDLVDEEGLVDESKDGQTHTLCGLVTRVAEKVTKSQKFMAFITLEDLYDTVEVIAFPRYYDQYQSLFQLDCPVVVSGTLQIKEDETPKLMLQKAYPLNEETYKRLYKPQQPSAIYINVEVLSQEESVFLRTVATKFPGKAQIILCEGTTKKRIAFKNGVSVERGLLEALSVHYGKANIALKR